MQGAIERLNLKKKTIEGEGGEFQQFLTQTHNQNKWLVRFATRYAVIGYITISLTLLVAQLVFIHLQFTKYGYIDFDYFVLPFKVS